MNLLTCKICGFEGINLISHITKKHKISGGEYKKQFGNELLAIISDEQKKLLSIASKKWFENQENYAFYKENHRSIWQNKYWVEKGFTEEEASAIVAEKQRRVVRQETRDLLSSQRIGDQNNMSLVSIAARNNITIEEAKKFVPAASRIQEKHPFFGKHHTEEAKNKIVQNMPKKAYKTSKGEKELQDFVSSLNEDAKFNFPFEGYNVDIILKNKKIIIEYFGDYWHANPRKYAADKSFKHRKTAKEIWEKYQRKILKLENMGFKVLIIWEDDWKRNREQMIKELNDAVNQ